MGPLRFGLLLLFQDNSKNIPNSKWLKCFIAVLVLAVAFQLIVGVFFQWSPWVKDGGCKHSSCHGDGSEGGALHLQADRQ